MRVVEPEVRYLAEVNAHGAMEMALSMRRKQ
jgi:hypothetical protein